MNTLVTAADRQAAPAGVASRKRGKRLGKLLLLGFAAKALVLAAGLGGGLELLRSHLPPAAQAKAANPHQPSLQTAD